MGQNYIPMDYDENNIMEIFYDPELNYFTEASFGEVIYDIYRLIEPWKIMLFKKDKVDRVFDDRTRSFFVELYYLGSEDLV